FWHAAADIKALRALGDWGFFRGDYLAVPRNYSDPAHGVDLASKLLYLGMIWQMQKKLHLIAMGPCRRKWAPLLSLHIQEHHDQDGLRPTSVFAFDLSHSYLDLKRDQTSARGRLHRVS
ncbi:hypothetical protein VDS19_17500, partial [Xanthomonas campestris pv. campestris]|nr:hypothetical protein [Xanthomonas campestris pv. campestris]